MLKLAYRMGSIEEAVNAVAEKEGVLTVANQDVECTESFLVRMDLALKVFSTLMTTNYLV